MIIDIVQYFILNTKFKLEILLDAGTDCVYYLNKRGKSNFRDKHLEFLFFR